MNSRFTRTLLLAIGGGACAGYTAACTLEMWRDLRAPRTPTTPDRGRYVRVRRAIDLTDTARSTIALLVLLAAPPADVLERATRALPPWLRPAAFAAALAAVTALLDLPIAYVHDLELERAFGLTERSTADWSGELLKSAILSSGLIALLAALLGAAMRRTPRRWPLLAGLLAFPLLALGNAIAPWYVLPLFNRFEPLEGGELESRLRALAARYGVGDAEILRMDLSRQTRKANAFVTGIGRAHRIVLADTLLDGFTADEIAFVVAHELGHYVSRDVWRSIAAGGVLASALFLLANQRGLDPQRPSAAAHAYARMLLWGLLLRPIVLAFGRARERAADRFAVRATGDPRAGVAAFGRLRERNLADDDPPPWYVLLFASHPTLRSRIDALETFVEHSP